MNNIEEKTLNTSKKVRISEKLRNYAYTYSILIAAIILVVVFSFTSERFLSYANIVNVMQQISIVGIVAIGTTMVIVSGDIDLSPDGTVLLGAVITGTLITSYSFNIFFAMLIGIAAGAFIGFLNGILIEFGKVNSVIITLGMMFGIRGLGQIILGRADSWISMDDPVSKFIAQERFGFIPILVIILFAMYIIAYIILNYTIFGRSIYAIGNNRLASRLTGIKTVNTKIAIFIFGGALYAFAGVLLSMRTSAILPALGDGIIFQAITAAILGGISVKGGIGRIQNVLIGAFVVGIVSNYMTLAGISAYFRNAATGFIILLAVIIDRIARGREN